MTVPMIPTLINERWTLLLPEHRAARPEWPYWEKERLASMYEGISPGSVVYDIGAEEGDFPALFAQWGAEVVLVEPNPLVWPNIRAIFEANGLTDKIIGSFVGFASDVRSEPTGTDPNWPGLSIEEAFVDSWPECSYGELIGNHGFRHLSQETDTTPQETIDNMVVKFGRVPTHITMDIEGSEMVALRGAEATLTLHRPTVWVSVHTDTMKDFYMDAPDELYSFMDDLNYERTHLAYDHESHDMFTPR